MAASPFFPKLPSGWSTEFLTALNGDLSLRIWRSPDLSRGRFLYLVHGQSEQGDRYEHFPHYLNGLVDAIVAVDLPGHGKSKGIRGHIENFDDYSKAVLAGFEIGSGWMKKQAGKFEAHWFGHSLGGLITLRTLSRAEDLPLRSVTVSAPLLDLVLPVPKLKRFFGELIEPIFGSLKLSNELNGDLVAHDPEVASEHDNNPLNHSTVTPRFFVNMMKDMPATREYKGPFPYNLMIIVPLADPIVSWQATYKFFADLRMKEGRRKLLNSFPGFFHEPFNEIGKERAFNALAEWLAKNSA